MEEKHSISKRLQHGWNAFKNKDPANINNQMFINPLLTTSTFRLDRKKPTYSIDPTMINSILTRIAIDAASSTFEHIRTDSEGGYQETINSSLNNIFNLEANIDQSGQEFIFDMIVSMLDTGCVAVVPIDTKINPESGLGGYDIETMRTGKITNWWPDRVAVDVYNDRTGVHQTITVMKKSVAILTNPFYSVMNEPNSTLKRLNRRLSLLDKADERNGSNKLDMIIQLPYVTKSEMKINQAEKRREQLVTQLRESEYGIAYADGTEKIIQLNRPIENNLIANIEYLTNLLFSQLGLSPEIFNMSADEQAMKNYYKRQIDPINDTVVNEFRRKFLTKTARSQKQTIWHHSDPFKFTPTSDLAEIADKLIRNQVLTGNEMRGIIGYKPNEDPQADKLTNPNMPQPPIESEEDFVENEGNEGVGSWKVNELT